MMMRDADRGVSTAVSYVLMLGITALLTTALITSFAPFVTNQQQTATQSTIAVIGNDIAGDIESVDRLVIATEAETETTGTVKFRTRLPDRLAGSRYEIEIHRVDAEADSPYDYEIVLRTVDFEMSTVTELRTQTEVTERTGSDALDGGTLQIEYDPDTDRLVVDNA